MNHNSWLVLLIFMMAAVTSAEACQVPVFRYALERWPADPWRISVSAENTDLSHLAEKANIELTKDPGITGKEIKIFRPGNSPRPVWEGTATPEMIETMLDSPARKELKQRIFGGDSVVWIFLKGSDEAENKAALDTLMKSMEIAKQKIQIPEGVVTPDEVSSDSFSGDPDDIVRDDIPLKIDFSLLQVSRDDPAESFFLFMLLSIEDDLHEFSDSPMVFPAFGRGRFLEPLIAKGINQDTILEYSAYLCGACSCEVKNQNPGMDLILAANWMKADAADVVDATKAAEPKPVTVQIGAKQTATFPGGRIWPIALAFLLIITGTAILMRRDPQE